MIMEKAKPGRSGKGEKANYCNNGDQRKKTARRVVRNNEKRRRRRLWDGRLCSLEGGIERGVFKASDS